MVLRKYEPNGIITLTTDFGTRDIFVGVMKGVILKINPRATVVDITHEIPRHDVHSAAFLLDSAYRSFPQGTIHLVVIDPGVGGSRRGLAVQTNDYYFVAPDNGVLTKTLSNPMRSRVVSLKNKSYFLSNVSQTFHGRDIFAPVAAYLSNGTTIDKFGPKVTDPAQITIATPEFTKHCIYGRVRYIDKFGNLITNIDKESLLDFCGKSPYAIRMKDRNIRHLCNSYNESKEGELIAIINSFDLLEIAMYRHNAAVELDIACGTEVQVEHSFYR